jgi:hypothetical protein
MTAYLPVALALLGTALMAVVIFAPVPVPATVTMSFAPPIPPAHDRPQPAFWAPPDDPLALWPVRLDPRAATCDAAARIGLVEALESVGGDWARDVLRGALDDEPDAAVRAAIERALRELRPANDAVRRLGGYEDGLA